MSKALQRILNSGVDTEQSSFINKRVRSANELGVILGVGLCLITLLIAEAYFPALRWVAIAPAVLFPIVILLNEARLNQFARIYLSLIVVLWSAFLHAGIVQTGQEPIAALSVLQLALAVVSVRIMDPREKSFNGVLIAIALIILGFPIYESLLEFDVSLEKLALFRQGWVGFLFVMVSLVIFFVIELVILRDNREFEDQTEALLAESEKQTKQREESEKELRESLAKLQTAQEEERERQWVAQGLTELQGIMRQNSDNIQSVYDAVLSFLVNYLGANQGALLTVEREDELTTREDDGYIELKSTYAYRRKKFLKRDIAIGEGLIGQAYLERDYIYMTDVPDDYVKITSGLGEARPRCVMIMPLMENDLVQGFIELASFKELAPYQISYLEQAATSIASFLRSSSVGQRTKELLVQAQQQAEEMKAQEEEMRQNTEEIYAMTKKFRQKDKDNQVKIKELEAKIKELEEQNSSVSS